MADDKVIISLEADDNLSPALKAVEDAGAAAGSALVDALTPVVDTLQNLQDAAAGLASEPISIPVTPVMDAASMPDIEPIEVPVTVDSQSIEDLDDALDNAATVAEDAKDAVDDFANATVENEISADQFYKLIDAYDELETELSDLKDAFQNLEGDYEQLQEETDTLIKEEKKLEEETKEVGQGFERSGEATESWMSKLAQLGMIITGLKSGFDMIKGGFDTIISTGKGWIDAQAESEQATKRLEIRMRATGESAGWTSGQIVALADDLEKVTRFESETTQEAAAMLTQFKNIKGDVFVDVIKSAQDMAAATGGDLQGSIFQLGRALENPAEGFHALRRAGIMFNEQEQKNIQDLVKHNKVLEAQTLILDQVKDRMGGAAEEMGKTWSDKMAALEHRFGNIAETLGSMLIPIFDQLIPLFDYVEIAFENLVPYVEEFVAASKEWGALMLEEWKPTFEWLYDVLLEAASWVIVLVQNWNDAWELAVTVVAYQMVALYNEVAYYLTDVLPEVVLWFGQMWIDSWKNMGKFTLTILSNMTTNIGEFIAGVKDYLTGGGDGFKFTALLDGFEMTLTELPKIKDRVEGEVEKTLREDSEKLADGLGKKASDQLAKTRAFMTDIFTKKEDPDRPDYSKVDHDPGKPERNKTKDDGSGKLEGLEELNKRITQAAWGESKKDKPVNAEMGQDIVENTQVAADATLSMSDSMERLNTSINEDFVGFVDSIAASNSEMALDMSEALETGNTGLVDAFIETADRQIAVQEKTIEVLTDLFELTEGQAGNVKRVAETREVQRYE